MEKVIRVPQIMTEMGTLIDATLHPVDIGQFGEYHHFQLEFYPRTDTDIVTTVRINTITSGDLKDLSEVIMELSKKLKESERKQKRIERIKRESGK